MFLVFLLFVFLTPFLCHLVPASLSIPLTLSLCLDVPSCFCPSRRLCSCLCSLWLSLPANPLSSPVFGPYLPVTAASRQGAAQTGPPRSGSPAGLG